MDAQLADPNVLHTKPDAGDSLGVYAHRLAAGQGLVLALRKYSPGSVLSYDDEIFEKLTVWISMDEIHSERTFELPTPDVVVIFSRGASASPQWACSGVLESGRVRLEPQGTVVSVEVSGSLSVSSGECPRDIRIAFQARDIGTITAVTPWLGAEGNHPYRETYP